MWRRRININTTDCTERDLPISGWFLCETRRATRCSGPVNPSKLICSMTDVTNSWKRTTTTTTTTTTKRSSRPWVGPSVHRDWLSEMLPAQRRAKVLGSPAVLGVFFWLGRFNVFSTMNYLGISNPTGMLIQMHGFRYRTPVDGSMDIIHSISLYDNNI